MTEHVLPMRALENQAYKNGTPDKQAVSITSQKRAGIAYLKTYSEEYHKYYNKPGKKVIEIKDLAKSRQKNLLHYQPFKR
jgi:hypothetical protein